MRVNSNQNSSIQSTQTSETSQAGKAEKAKAKKAADAQADGAAGTPTATDTGAQISAKGREMAQAKSIADQAPEIREAKIAELKKKIAAGKYSVDANAVADRMVDDHLKAGIG